MLEKSGNTLIVETGGDKLALIDWYAAGQNQSIDKLQFITEAMAGYDQDSANPLLDDKIERFDFKTLVQGFDEARAQNAMMQRWSAMHKLLDAHLASSDTEALGGDLAYRYGMTGSLSGIGAASAHSILASPQFGGTQALQPLASLEEGLVRLK